MSPCPVDWCTQTSPHAIHQSAVMTMDRGPGRWNISLGLIDGSEHPYVTVYYLSQDRGADLHWPVLLADVPDVARFTARLGEAQIAAAIESVAALAGELTNV